MSVTTVSPTQVVRELGLMVSNEAVALKAGIPDYSKKFSAGASGQEVKIAKPAKFNTVSGTWDVSSSGNNVIEGSVSLTMPRTPISVPIYISDDQAILDFEDFKNQVLVPAKDRLLADMESRFLQAVMPGIGNHHYAAAFTASAAGQMKKILTKSLCPANGRVALLDPDLMQDIVDDTKGLFNGQTKIGTQNDTGDATRWNGLKLLESTIMPAQTTGTRTATAGCLVETTMVEGSATLILDIGAASNTIKKGEIIKVVGRKSVNPITKDVYSSEYSFVCTADVTATSGVVSVTVGEAIYASSTDARRNISSLPTAGDAVIFVGAGSSAGITQGLVFHPMAFATAFAELEVANPAMGARTKVPGTNLSIRYEKERNLELGKTLHRFDVMMATALVEPLFAARFLRTATLTSA